MRYPAGGRGAGVPARAVPARPTSVTQHPPPPVPQVKHVASPLPVSPVTTLPIPAVLGSRLPLLSAGSSVRAAAPPPPQALPFFPAVRHGPGRDKV